MLIVLIPAMFAAFTAIVYCEVLMLDGMLLDWWARVLDRMPKWLGNPLGGCVYCFGGQLALWSGFFIWNDYKLLYHFLFIMTTIFFIHIYKLWNSNI